MKLKLKHLNYDWQYFFKTFQNLSNHSSDVIEIGASVPEKTKMLAKYCRSLTGVDLFKEAKPKDHDNIKYIRSDWQHLSKKIPQNSYDIVVSSHTIEHIQNDLDALNQSYSILKPGGVALLLTPNRQRLVRSLLEIFTGPRSFPQWEHIREYSEADLIKLIQQSKFKKYEITPLIFGIHAYIAIFIYKVPHFFRKYANYWQIILYK